MIRKIETYEQLMNWANRANTFLDLKQKIALQDEMGRSLSADIQKIYGELSNPSDRRIIIFGLLKIMDHSYADEFVTIWAKTVAAKYKEEYANEFIERMRTVTNQEEALRASKKYIYRRIRTLIKANEILTARIKLLETSIFVAKKARIALTERNKEQANALRLTENLKIALIELLKPAKES